MSSLKAKCPVPERFVRTASDKEAVRIGCYWDVEKANKVGRFFKKVLRHTKGSKAGKPFLLLKWEWEEIILPLYAWRMPDGTRRFRNVKVIIPKKNGKSTLTAGIALYECCEGEQGSQICVAAGDRKQAKIIFDECVNMAERSKYLMKVLKIVRSHNTIRHKKRQSKIEPLSADVEKKEGLDPTVVIMDELHTQPDRKLWNTLRFAMAARAEPIHMWLSTAGEYDETALWWEEFDYARKVINGEVVDISVLAVIYEASKDDQWDSLDTFIRCNPSYGKTLDKRSVEEDIQRARINGAEKLIYLRYRLNIPTSASATWLPDELWNACADSLENFKPQKGDIVYGGLDLSLSHDLSAFVVLVIRKPHFYIFPYFWLPESVFEHTKHDKRNHERYRAWKDFNLVKFTDCSEISVVDYDVVVSDISYLCKAWGVKEICIDKWNEARVAANLRRELKRKGLATGVSTISANTQNMVQATSEFERLVKETLLKHPNHAVLNWMFKNTRLRVAPNGNYQISKGDSTEKIDGIYATAVSIALHIDVEREESKEENKTSRYLDPNAEVYMVG